MFIEAMYCMCNMSMRSEGCKAAGEALAWHAEYKVRRDCDEFLPGGSPVFPVWWSHVCERRHCCSLDFAEDDVPACSSLSGSMVGASAAKTLMFTAYPRSHSGRCREICRVRFIQIGMDPARAKDM